MVAHDDTIARRFNEIERQIRDLATSQRASNTTITDDNGNVVVQLTREGLVIYDPSTSGPILWLGPSGLTMYDGDGDSRTHVGRLGASYGHLVLDAEGQGPRIAVDDNGMHAPYLTVPAVETTSYRDVTAGSFEATHFGRFEITSHLGLYCWVAAGCDTGTTGEVRIRNVTTGATTATVPVTDSGIYQQFRWLHGANLGTGPINFEIEARRTSGAGLVRVWEPSGSP